ncbi:MAG: hypothetical protein ACI4LA_03590 [Emergencia sp.]
MNLRDNIVSQIAMLERLQKKLNTAVGKMPKERLIRKNAGGTTYYYIKKGEKMISLLHDPALRDQYLKRELYQKQLKQIEADLPLLRKVLKKYQPLLPDNSWWYSLKQEQNPFKKENRIHLYKGVYYRSKSEMLIASLLISYGIEFRYEAAYTINGRTIYPDFIVKRPRDGKIFIWEHFGKISDEQYSRDVFGRLSEYHRRGIDLWDQLLISFDQEDGALNVDNIDKMIRLYLL